MCALLCLLPSPHPQPQFYPFDVCADLDIAMLRRQADTLEIKTRINRKSNSDNMIAMRAELKRLQEKREQLRVMLQDVLINKPKPETADERIAKQKHKKPNWVARLAKSTFVQVGACPLFVGARVACVRGMRGRRGAPGATGSGCVLTHAEAGCPHVHVLDTCSHTHVRLDAALRPFVVPRLTVHRCASRRATALSPSRSTLRT